MRELTVLFSDIRGFTSISESLGANDLTRFLNRFFTPLTAVIMRNKGTVDKFIGDAIMAYWNAPLTVPSHPEKACRSALEMLAAVDAFNSANVGQTSETGDALPEVRIGVGLNTGMCCVGNMGADQRFDYSAIGDPVNVASRLEGETKGYGVPIIVGEATANAVPHFALLRLGSIRVRGRLGASNVYALAGDETKAGDPGFIAVRAANDRYLACLANGDGVGAVAALAEFRRLGGAEFAKLADRREEEIEAAPLPLTLRSSSVPPGGNRAAG